MKTVLLLAKLGKKYTLSSDLPISEPRFKKRHLAEQVRLDQQTSQTQPAESCLIPGPLYNKNEVASLVQLSLAESRDSENNANMSLGAGGMPSASAGLV